MKKNLLTVLLLFSVILGCKKAEQVKQPKSLTGKKFESYWFTASGGERFYYRLNFKSDTEVEYFVTFIDENSVTSDGKSKLSYSIDDPMKEFPQIHIVGTLNNLKGEPNKGDKVDYWLNYIPKLGNAKASLDMKGRYYTEY